jgi:uncharacterized protein YdaU (DUF1376 family)
MSLKPWMRWHVARWKNSARVFAMTLAARGAYFELLQAAWESGGKLPNAPDLLWRYARAGSKEEFEAVRAEVLPMFTVSDDQKFLINDTLAAEWEDAEARMKHVSQVRSEAGKRGNEKRWKNRKIANRSQTVAQDSTEQDSTLQGKESSEPIHSGKRKKKPCASAIADGAANGSPQLLKPGPDERHKPVELHIKEKHLQRFAIACQWDGSEGKALAEMLAGNKGWTLAQVKGMVDNVFFSINDCGRPRGWLRNLSRWAGGPKDEYGKTISLFEAEQALTMRREFAARDTNPGHRARLKAYAAQIHRPAKESAGETVA